MRLANACNGPAVRAADFAASQSTWRTSEAPLLGDPAVAGGLRAGLPHPWVKAEIPDEVARHGEASDVSDLGHERGRDDQVDAGNGHQSPDLLTAQGVAGKLTLDDRDLAVQKRDLAQAALHRGLLVSGQALLVKPRAAALAKQIADRGTLDQVARQHRVISFLERVR